MKIQHMRAVRETDHIYVLLLMEKVQTCSICKKMTFSPVSVSIFLSPEPHPSEQRRHWTLDSSIRREKSTGGRAGQLQTAEVWRPRVEAGVHVGTRGQTRGGGAGPDIVTNCYTQKSEIIRLQRRAQVAATPVVSCLSSPRGSLLTSQSRMITKIVTVHSPYV